MVDGKTACTHPHTHTSDIDAHFKMQPQPRYLDAEIFSTKKQQLSLKCYERLRVQSFNSVYVRHSQGYLLSALSLLMNDYPQKTKSYGGCLGSALYVLFLIKTSSLLTTFV